MMWLLLAIFCGVLAWIVSLRLGSGEIYPEYSSFRADPIGGKGFYESLDRLPGRRTSRHLQPFQRLVGDKEATVYLLGTGAQGAVDLVLYNKIESLAREGTRVVIALNATDSHTAMREEDRINNRSLPLPRDNESAKMDKEKSAPGGYRGPQLALIDPQRREQEEILATLVTEGGEAGQEGGQSLPRQLRWYGRYCFQKLSDEWQSIYEARGKPVVVEQQIGLGTIVLCADSFLFSNEALARDRSPNFLLWTAGGAKNIIFDESHLGVSHGTSIMLLLRDMRLQGLFFGILVLAGLWVWRASASFVPPYTEEGAGEVVQGKTAREGIVHLLERNLPADELPEICLKEWRKSYPNLNTHDAARYAEAERLLIEYLKLPKKERDPAGTYAELAKALSK
jgi:hypothetical protein